MSVAFMRNKLVEVEPLPDGVLAVFWRLADDLLDLEIELSVRPPDLEIIAADARVKRSPFRDGISAQELIQRAVGVRVGPGLRKIVRGLVGGGAGSPELTEGVLECANAVILHFTRPTIGARGSIDIPEEDWPKAVPVALEANPRLRNSCIAFIEEGA
jgi:hypothetical protein